MIDAALLGTRTLVDVRSQVHRDSRVVFDPDGSYVEDVNSGEAVWLKEQGGMYMLKMWEWRKTMIPVKF